MYQVPCDGASQVALVVPRYAGTLADSAGGLSTGRGHGGASKGIECGGEGMGGPKGWSTPKPEVPREPLSDVTERALNLRVEASGAQGLELEGWVWTPC